MVYGTTKGWSVNIPGYKKDATKNKDKEVFYVLPSGKKFTATFKIVDPKTNKQYSFTKYIKTFIDRKSGVIVNGEK